MIANASEIDVILFAGHGGSELGRRRARGKALLAAAGSPLGIECGYCRAAPGQPCAVTKVTASIRETGFHRARVLGESPPTGQRRAPRPRTLQHGLSYTPEYRAWQLIRLRCLDPKHAAYPRYGGRVIALLVAMRDTLPAVRAWPHAWAEID